MTGEPIQGPPWDLTSEYSGPDAPEIQTDLDTLSELLDRIEKLNEDLDGAGDSGGVVAAQAIYKIYEQARGIADHPDIPEVTKELEARRDAIEGLR